MIESLVYAVLASILVSLISFVGLFVLSSKFKQSRLAMMLLVSFAAGSMFAAAFLDLLPESIETSGGSALPLALVGIVIFFMVEKLLYWHHHHSFEHSHKHENIHHHAHPVGYLNIIGDGIHNFLDGIAIGASFLTSIPLGIVTTIAVVAHEIPQEVGDFSVLLHAGFTRRKALFYNFLSALTAVIGAIIPFLLESQVSNLESILLPIAAGGFIYIAGSDLVPELTREERLKHSLMQLAAFGLGIALIWIVVTALEA